MSNPQAQPGQAPFPSMYPPQEATPQQNNPTPQPQQLPPQVPAQQPAPQPGGYAPAPGYGPQPGGFQPYQQSGYAPPPQQTGFPPQPGYAPQQPGSVPPPYQTGYAPQYQPQYGAPPYQPQQYQPYGAPQQPGSAPPPYQPQGHFPQQPGPVPVAYQTGYAPPYSHQQQYAPQFPGQAYQQPQLPYPPQQYAPQQPGYGYGQQPQVGYYPLPTASPPGFATLVTNNNFSADADILYNAMKGMGTDDKQLIAIIGSRSRTQLREIDLVYRTKYGKPLAHRLGEDTSGHFKKVLMNVVQLPEETDATYLYHSMAGLGTDESTLSEIMATRSAEEMERIKMAHTNLFNTGLEKMIKGDTSGEYETLLLILLNMNLQRMPDAAPIDVNKAAADAQRLHDTPSGSTFNQILGTNNNAQNIVTRDQYEARYGTTLTSLIKKKCSGDHEKLLLLLVVPRLEVFCERAYSAMKGIGTNEEKLIRVITTRYGIDLPQIKQMYATKYGKSLFDHVKSEVSGNFGKLLLELIAHS